ncbi:MAG: chemotaxis protein CheW [Anaerolineae bacterium]|nr:chemotaxis protein CheW [Anaerolineae bacterium]
MMPEFVPLIPKSTKKTETPLLTFRLDQQQYALLIEDVIEVAAMVEMIRIAGARPELPGMVNRHGKPLQLLDLRVIFEQPTPPMTAATLFIVAQHGRQMAGLIVDEVLQVEYVADTGYSAGAAPYIRGIISQTTRLIQVVSLAALLHEYLLDASKV